MGKFLPSYSNLSRLYEYDDKSLRRVYWRISVKIFVSATEFCRRNMSAHKKIKSDRICATCRPDKILLQKKRFFHKNSPVHTKWFVAATCGRNVLLAGLFYFAKRNEAKWVLVRSIKWEVTRLFEILIILLVGTICPICFRRNGHIC